MAKPHSESVPGNLRGDNPIRRPEEDILGRAKVARSFAEQVLSLDSREGLVVGVLGPWGSGKTSFVNLARPHLESAGVTILDFNPWMFSGAEQLVESFFIELSAQLKVRHDLAGIGEALEEYGEAFSGMGWLPIAGPWLERGRAASKMLGTYLKRRKEGASARRARIEKALAGLEKPLAVVLDDIDRLTTREIQDIFRLVRLSASFPNIVYIVAFDRARVESALSESGIPGRDYLEKILQVAVDLPAVPGQVLIREVTQAIDAVLGAVNHRGPFDRSRWPDVFMEILRPLVRNMRDVRRFSASVQGTLRDLDDQVTLEDLLALEAIRVFLPDVFRVLPEAVEGLTSTSRAASDEARLLKQVEGLFAAGGDRANVVRALVTHLFPAGQRHFGGADFGSDWGGQWLRERRVAHESILRLYLERVAGAGLTAFCSAEVAWRRMADRRAFDQHLRSLELDSIQDVISSLETFEGQLSPDQVVPGTIVLLNLLPEIPDRETGMFGLDKSLVVGRVVLRLLRSLKNPTAVEAAVRKILPEVLPLHSKLKLVTMVGYHPNAGHKLVSEDVACELERLWRAEVRAAPPDALIGEEDLLTVLLLAMEGAVPGEPPLRISNSPLVTYAILRAARSTVRMQTVGQRAVQSSMELRWDSLLRLVGDEDALMARVETLRASQLEVDLELLELVGRYAGGWRPRLFDHE